MNKRNARLAGAIYLIVVLAGTFSLGYVPSKLIVWKDAAQTFRNISASELLFRFSIFSNFICYIAFLLLPLVLYKILRQVNEGWAKLMVILVIVSIPISFMNIQNKMAILTVVGDAAYLKTYSTTQLQSQVMFFLDSYYNGMLINQIFWGLWLFPFGYLVYKSGFLPKILGIFLMLGCFGYLINVTGEMLIPGYNKSWVSGYVRLPASIGEICTCLWLLIIGIREKAAIQSPDVNLEPQ